MAKEWQTVSDEERKICEDIAKQNKAAYDEALKAYREQLKAAAGAHAADVDDGDEVRRCALARGFHLADADIRCGR